MPATSDRPVALIVLDGWGYREQRDGNAIALANVPTWDKLWSTNSRTLLHASGRPVGLPDGQMGNSEVGHLNLGAGRVVKQDIVRISDAIADGSFRQNPALTAACRRARAKGGTVHLIGLVGTGGVHAINEHLLALVDLASAEGVPRIKLHLLLDGRDTLPRSGQDFLREILARTEGRAELASVGGRYYGMDRDRRWDRTEKFYRAAVDAAGPREKDAIAAIARNYESGTSDEFILPFVLESASNTASPMTANDEVICFNFRSDRMRQIVRALTDPDFDGFAVGGRPPVQVTTLTSYDQTFDLPVAFEPFSMSRIVAQVVSEAGKTMFRTAETEKYAHVTYFFNGGHEPPFPGEVRSLVQSQRVATYDLAPEMSADGVTDVLCSALESGEHNFILCNYANGDMVGHSGSLEATIRAVECVDRCLARVVQSANKAGARLLITADHGNCEYMIDEASGGPHTAHTCNPVPLIVLDPAGDAPLRSGGALCDVGPTVLTLLGLEKPLEMSGVDLRRLDVGTGF